MCFSLCLAPALHAQERLRAGNWESTVTTHGQTRINNACLSAHDAAMSNGPAAEVRAGIETALAKGGKCKLADFKLEGNTRTETMVCGADTIHNETTFHGGESFETTSTRTRAGVATASNIKGKRTGDCKADK
jgi:hypothetical protein